MQQRIYKCLQRRHADAERRIDDAFVAERRGSGRRVGYEQPHQPRRRDRTARVRGHHEIFYGAYSRIYECVGGGQV